MAESNAAIPGSTLLFPAALAILALTQHLNWRPACFVVGARSSAKGSPSDQFRGATPEEAANG